MGRWKLVLCGCCGGERVLVGREEEKVEDPSMVVELVAGTRVLYVRRRRRLVVPRLGQQ